MCSQNVAKDFLNLFTFQLALSPHKSIVGVKIFISHSPLRNASRVETFLVCEGICLSMYFIEFNVIMGNVSHNYIYMIVNINVISVIIAVINTVI